MKVRSGLTWVFLLSLAGCLFAGPAFSVNLVTTVVVPEEYEIASGQSLGFGNAGSVAFTGLGSLKLNPAMLAVERNYSLDGSYHWSASGRDFYKVGVVDSKTSSVAAGVAMTSFLAPPKIESMNDDQSRDGRYVARRIGLGAAYSFRLFALGVAGQWTEAGFADPELRGTGGTQSAGAIRGTSLNAGVAGMLTSSTRVGLSVEGLQNSKVKDSTPRYLRAGLASLFLGGQASFHMDWQRRELLPTEQEPEQLITGSFSVRVYDYLRLLGAYGRDPQPGHERSTAAAGIALVGPKMSLSYTASRPDLREEESHQALNLNIELSM